MDEATERAAAICDTMADDPEGQYINGHKFNSFSTTVVRDVARYLAGKIRDGATK